MSEGALVKQCLEFLKWKGFEVWRNNTGARGYIKFGHIGSGDIIGYQKKSGRFITIECKTKTGVVRDKQIEFVNKALENGCIAAIVRSLEELEREIAFYC